MPSLKTVFLAGLFFIFSTLPAQHSDCQDPIVVEGLHLSINKVDGPGKVLEIKGNKLGNERYFTEEHNTVWLLLKAPGDGEMTFEITPQDPNDDWDFMLFEGNAGSCDSIIAKTLTPIRSNLARNDHANGGKTGLSHSATAPFEPAGEFPNYSKWLEVAAGKEYVLVVDINQNNGKGFAIDFSIKEWENSDIHLETAPASSSGFMDMTETLGPATMVPMKFQIIDKNSGKPITCNATVKGTDWMDSSITFTNTSEFEFNMPADNWFFLNVTKQGHTFSSEKYKADASSGGQVRKIFISELKTGGHIVLEEIVFRENTTHLLPSSVNALEQLIQFMKEYPTAEIEIQGHVNAPGYENEGKVKRFSEKRAEQVKIYLIDAGIDAGRIKIRGMGNEFMLYQNPQTYDQEKANRRVEIEILGL
ncbi:MAG: OmpA family protein [Vicingaceae bacterium]